MNEQECEAGVEVVREYRPYQQRVVDEKKELDEKIQRLGKFLESDNDIDRTDLSLLFAQLSSMQTYSQILKIRISRF